LQKILRLRDELKYSLTFERLRLWIVVQNILEDIFLVVYFFIELSHITAKCQKCLFDIILIVYDMKWDEFVRIVSELNHTQFWVFVLEKYL
jgi:hypothetical protein